MNPAMNPFMVVSVAVVSIVPSAVLVWYMFWRREEGREMAKKIDTLVAALSRSEEAVDRVAHSRDTGAEDYPEVRGMSIRASGSSHTRGVATTGSLTFCGDGIDAARPLTAAQPVFAQEVAVGEISPASIGKARALLRGGISPVEVARTLNIGLGEVTLLHRLIGVTDQRQAVPA